ncbi:hypothetical protein H072_9320 [Dactylellina haptotyla CBS 200.50]|uniref:Dipeptidase n=1 Tax=Dactylellina haptotyla (strain CBS 200.50) TaxID=1284197 RepID=S8BPC9_DACHA|nr:hypothetical protein H072_9320 [Dactylellina haptotyla CBS 200.50]
MTSRRDDGTQMISVEMEKQPLDYDDEDVERHSPRPRAPEPFLQRYLGNPKYLLPLIAVVFLTAAHFNGFLSKRADVDLSNAYEVFKPRNVPLTLDERVDQILSSSPLIDTHIDLPLYIRFLYQNHIYGDNFTDPFKTGDMHGQIDIPRLRSGKVGGVFWSVFTECPASSLDPNEEFKDEVYYESIHDTIQQIDVTKRMVRAFPDHFGWATSARDFEHIFKSSRGKKVASVLGIEGLHQIGNSPAAIRLFYEVGVRYITLTHNCNNRYADGALVPAPHWNGLNPTLGPKMIQEFNRLGMIVDLSHVSPATMKDVLAITQAPVIFSHSSAFALTNHPRNVPDDVLELVKKNGGVVQINFAPDFITQTGDGKATLEDVADHVIYIGERIGFEHVGFGSDFDGIPTVPKGLEDVSKYPVLVNELLNRGISDSDVSKVAGKNVLRVWREVEKTAERLQKEGVQEMEDDVKKMQPENRRRVEL